MFKNSDIDMVRILYQRTNGPVNAHLISRPCISTKHTKPGYKWPSDFLV